MPPACRLSPPAAARAQAATPAQAEELVAGYRRLVDTAPGGMGGAYLALALTSAGLPGPPVGFEDGAADGGGGEPRDPGNPEQ